MIAKPDVLCDRKVFLINFKQQFAEMVESGEKRQTIRRERKGHRQIGKGDHLKLYTGLRTKQCRLLGEDGEAWHGGAWLGGAWLGGAWRGKGCFQRVGALQKAPSRCEEHQSGVAGHGMAGRGGARLGKAWQGLTWHGMARLGKAWFFTSRGI